MFPANIELCGKKILITGMAGFIGSNLAQRLLSQYDGIHVIGFDNMSSYYDVDLKTQRLKRIEELQETVNGKYSFIQGDIADDAMLMNVFEQYCPDIVVNLAAQGGVRYSIENPSSYIESNLVGFFNVLECCRHSYDGKRKGVEHLLYASSSSVYGSNEKLPYSTEDKTDQPVSLYAATKKSNELMAYVYSKLYGIPATGLRFFTVYGPAGRPDMAYFSFTEKLVKREPIKIFNYGNCKRDFTYIDDIVTGIEEVMKRCPPMDCGGIRYKLYNIGNNHPENLLDFVNTLYMELKRVGVLPEEFNLADYMQLVPMQPGDVETTYADITELEKDIGFRPCTSLQQGLRKFAEWYKDYTCPSV